MNAFVEKLPKEFLKSLNWQQLNKTLPTTFNVILIIACSYTLSQLTWLFVPTEETSTQAPQSKRHVRNNTAQREQQQKIQSISDAHLFGRYQSKVSEPVKTDAPETRLNLELKGVLAAVPMANASAIIAMGKNGKEDIYGINDKVSSATIKEIHSDRVILGRGGRFETLRLPKDFGQNTLIKSSESTPPDNFTSSTPSTPGEVLGDIRQKIMKNPTSFGEYAIPIPFNENGKLRGYRLQPQKDRALFDQVGLDPNDVVVAINGVTLDNPANGLKALRALQKAKHVNITVLRNGAEIPLSFDIP